MKITNKPVHLYFVRCIHVISGNEFGQQSAEYMAAYDIILIHVRKSNVYMGRVLLLGTLDHMQIQPANNQRPFLTENSIISCYKMIVLKRYVRSTGDAYFEVKYLVRKDCLTFDKESNLIERFRHLCSNTFTFVSRCNNPRIPITSFRLYSKKLLTREAIRVQYVDSLNLLRTRKAIDTEKYRYPCEWVRATLKTSLLLDHKFKESSQLLFLIGDIFECTFNA